MGVVSHMKNKMKSLATISQLKLLASVLTSTAASIAAATGAPVPMTGAGSYTQDFNSFSSSSSPKWSNDSTLPGWYVDRGNGSAQMSLFASVSGSTFGSIYNFGSSGSSDRALGSIASTQTGLLAYGVVLKNASGADLVIHSLAYVGEQWRGGGNTAAHTIGLSYKVSASELTDADASAPVPATWTALAAGNFTGPVAEASTSAVDGNSPANRVSISVGPNVTVPAGSCIMFRWADPNDSGNDHGLALDDLTIAWHDPVVGLPDYDTWAAATGAVEGLDGDDDGDDLDNAYEYAFGLDPGSAASLNPFVVPLAKDTGSFTFTRRIQSLTNLTYKVFTSTTLAPGDWTEDIGANISVVGSPVNDVETVEVTLSGPKPLTAPSLFVRVVAE